MSRQKQNMEMKLRLQTPLAPGVVEPSLPFTLAAAAASAAAAMFVELVIVKLVVMRLKHIADSMHQVVAVMKGRIVTLVITLLFPTPVRFQSLDLTVVCGLIV